MKVKGVIKRLEAEGAVLMATPVADTDAAGEIKDPFTRLLDLTLGWGEYVEKDEAEHRDGVSSADLYDAYQSITEFAEPYWEAAPEVQEMAVRHFVDTRLLPLLLGKLKP